MSIWKEDSHAPNGHHKGVAENGERTNENEKHCEQEKELIHVLQGQLKHAEEQLAYLSSDFDNFRRRIEKERYEISTTAQTPLLFDLLSIVDDFDRAFSELQSKPDLTPYLMGFELIYKALQKLLEKYEVTPIKELRVFNPELHEAVMQSDVEGKQSGDIVDVFEKGYFYKDTLLRPAKVSVKS